MHKGYIDFDVNEYSYIKEYKNSLQLLYFLIKFRPNLIFSQEPFALRMLFINLVTILYCLIFKKKYIILAIENIDPKTKYGKLATLLKPFFRLYIKNSFRIIPINKDSEKLVAKYSSKKVVEKFERLLFGVWGVDVDEFSPVSKLDDPNLGNNAILFVGRLIEGKGIRHLINAMTIVRQRVKDANLYIVGDGPLKEETKNYNSTWIHFLGSIANKELPGYFRAAKVTSVPSITTKKWAEQLGMVNIQSIACATPIVSTKSGSIPEFFPDGEVGMLVPEKNPDALADALTTLLNDDMLNKKLGEKGRKLVTAKYDMHKNTLKFEKFISQLSSQHSDL
jgi:glycosyltransferase involved in cell wall biosynthesis